MSKDNSKKQDWDVRYLVAGIILAFCFLVMNRETLSPVSVEVDKAHKNKAETVMQREKMVHAMERIINEFEQKKANGIALDSTDAEKVFDLLSGSLSQQDKTALVEKILRDDHFLADLTSEIRQDYPMAMLPSDSSFRDHLETLLRQQLKQDKTDDQAKDMLLKSGKNAKRMEP